MREPTPDDFDDPEFRELLDGIEDEIFLIREEELEECDWPPPPEEEDLNEEVGESFGRRGEWIEEDYESN